MSDDLLIIVGRGPNVYALARRRLEAGGRMFILLTDKEPVCAASSRPRASTQLSENKTAPKNMINSLSHRHENEGSNLSLEASSLAMPLLNDIDANVGISANRVSFFARNKPFFIGSDRVSPEDTDSNISALPDDCLWTPERSLGYQVAPSPQVIELVVRSLLGTV